MSFSTPIFNVPIIKAILIFFDSLLLILFRIFEIVLFDNFSNQILFFSINFFAFRMLPLGA